MKESQRIPGLDSLRAAAILAVIICHLVDFLPAYFPTLPPAAVSLLEFGMTGVDLFFVLSGFLIGGIILRELETQSAINLPQFYWRRWLRTLPAYFATLALIFIATRMKHHGQPTGLTWPYLVFGQTYFPPADDKMIWSWSLCVEEHFYLFLPLLVIALRYLWTGLPAKMLIRGLAVTAFLFTNAARLWIWKYHPGFNWHDDVFAFTHLRLDGLAVGLFVATLPRSGKIRREGILAVGALFGVSFIWGQKFAAGHPLAGLEDFAVVAVVYGVLVHLSAGGNRWSRLRLPGARLTSDLAYSLYLTHCLVIFRFAGIWPVRYPWLMLVAIVAVCYAAALVLRYGVEIPFLKIRDSVAVFRKWRAGRFYRNRSMPTP